MPQDTRTLSLYIGLGAIAAAVFAADLFTPLGVAVWILYILPVGLTLLGREPTAPILAAIGCTLLMVVTAFTDAPGQIVTWVAYINRACGVVAIWSMALLARSRIGVRTRLEEEDWLRRVQTQLLEAMQGELLDGRHRVACPEGARVGQRCGGPRRSTASMARCCA